LGHAFRTGTFPRRVASALFGFDGLFPQRFDVGPQFLPVRTIALGQFGEGVGVADAGEVGVLLPVGELGNACTVAEATIALNQISLKCFSDS
jgi:hypothetical protein